MKKIYIIVAIVLTHLVNAQHTWTNGNSTNLWSDPLNWDVGTVPSSGDDVIFDATSGANCTMDLDPAVTLTEMNNLDLNGYTGVISGSVAEVYVYGNYTQNSGTFNTEGAQFNVYNSFTLSGGNINAGSVQFGVFGLTTISAGVFTGSTAAVYHGSNNNFVLSGGTYNASSGTTDFEGSSFSKTGGTFNHNSGLFIFNVVGTTAFSGTWVFNQLEFTRSSAIPAQRTVNFGTSVSTATLSLNHIDKRFRYLGTCSITAIVKIVSGTTGAPTVPVGTFVLNGTNATIASSVTSGAALLPNVNINTSGVLSLSGNISTNSTWTHSSIAGFNSGTSTVSLCGGTVVSSGTTAATMATFDNLSAPTGFIGNLSGSSFVNVGKDLLVSGTFNCNTGRILLSGNLTHNGTYNSSTSLLVLQGSGAQAVNGSAATTSINAIQVNSGVTSLSHAVILMDSIKMTGGTFNGSNMTLRSVGALKARIANITGGTLNGPITVQAFAAGGTTDWSVLGVSGISSLTMSDWYDDFPMAIEGSATGVTSAGGYFESVQGWIETDAYGYDTTITIGSALTPGKGFWVYLGNALTTTGDITIDVTGTPVTGNVAVPVTSGGAQAGFNLVSNPYASPVSWAKVLALSAGMNNAVYIYNADVGQTQYVNGVPSHPPTSGASDIIPMGQGFYVESAGATMLNFNEACKVPSNTGANPLLKSSESQSTDPNIGTVIRLKVEGGGAVDYCAIRFHQNATTAFDGQYDAYKIYDSPGYVGYPGVWSQRTVIGTQLNNVDYGVNSIPYAHTQNAVIPVVVKVYGSGSYTISGSDLQNIPANACISLFDKVTNITHNLRASDYVCNINDTTNAARFVLTICADLTTNVPTQVAASNSIGISKDANGVFVAFDHEKPTDATIRVTNILGQTIMQPKKVKASKETVYLDINSDDQLIFVTVETNSTRTTKKILNK